MKVKVFDESHEKDLEESYYTKQRAGIKVFLKRMLILLILNLLFLPQCMQMSKSIVSQPYYFINKLIII